MLIESITTARGRNDQVLLLLESGEKIKIPLHLVADFGLYGGMDLEDERMEELLRQAQHSSARRRAARIAASTNLSEKRLRERLVQRGEDPEAADQAVEWLKEMGAMNDEHLAGEIRESCIRKGYGVERARQELSSRGIPREYWEDALADYPEMDQAQDALLEKRFRGAIPDRKAQQRGMEALVRRGYDWETARSAMRRYLASHEAEESLEDTDF